MVARIDIALLPGEQPEVPPDCTIVVDLFRATTTIAVLFARGLRRLAVTGDVHHARELRDELGVALFGEVGGLPPPDFDYGNSPVAAAELSLSGSDAVLFTTNGTAALAGASAHGRVMAGALANATAVADAAAKFDVVRIVCAGNHRGRRFSLEDAYGAAAIATRLRRRNRQAVLGDGAVLAMGSASRGEAAVRRSQHALKLAELGLGSDIDYALSVDTSPAVPTVVERRVGVSWLEDLRA